MLLAQPSSNTKVFLAIMYVFSPTVLVTTKLDITCQEVIHIICIELLNIGWLTKNLILILSAIFPTTSAPLEISHCEGKIGNQIINEHFSRMMQAH